MHALDLWLLNKLDALTTKLQRRGYRLTELYVNVAGVVLVLNVGSAWLFNGSLSLVFVGAVWGTWLWVSIHWANENKSYPESLKIMNNLNVKALSYREHERPLRCIWMGLGLLFTGLDVGLMVANGNIATHLVSMTATFSIWFMLHLHGCFYVGPGHFAKDRQEQLRGDEVLDR